jgi:hypothetical protein
MPLELPPQKRPTQPSKLEAGTSLLRCIERVAGGINPILMIFALGLAILDFTCYAGIVISRQPFMHTAAGAATVQVGTGAGLTTAIR